MTAVGITITGFTIAILLEEFFRHKRAPLAWYGWFGLSVLVIAECLMFRGVEPVATYFTPIAWTAYLMVVDAAVWSVRGQSRLRNEPRHFALTALLSVLLWLIFEAYNLRLEN